MLKLAFLVSGSGSNMQKVLDNIASGKLKATACVVISSNPDAYALERAKQAKVPAYVVTKEKREQQIITLLNKYDIDLIVLAGYLCILSKTFVDIFKNKIINIHPSLLPKYGGLGMYGLNVHKAVLAAKEAYSGATVHFVDAGTDTGKIIKQKSIKVLPTDTAESLQKRILEEVEHKLLTEAIQIFADKH